MHLPFLRSVIADPDARARYIRWRVQLRAARQRRFPFRSTRGAA